MRLLIVNADDFGLSQGVNEGILEAHTRGIVTSTSLMVSRPAAEQAAEIARGCPELSVGLHFVEEGDADLDDPLAAGAAFARQLERFRELIGDEPTHVDSHHHVHIERSRLPVFRRLVAPLAVPLRHDGPVRHIGGFWGQSESGASATERLSRTSLRHLVDGEAREGVSELGCHPALLRGDFQSSYVREREVELRTLTAPGLRQELESSGVTLVSFGSWRAIAETGS